MRELINLDQDFGILDQDFLSALIALFLSLQHILLSDSDTLRKIHRSDIDTNLIGDPTVITGRNHQLRRNGDFCDFEEPHLIAADQSAVVRAMPRFDKRSGSVFLNPHLCAYQNDPN